MVNTSLGDAMKKKPTSTNVIATKLKKKKAMKTNKNKQHNQVYKVQMSLGQRQTKQVSKQNSNFI